MEAFFEKWGLIAVYFAALFERDGVFALAGILVHTKSHSLWALAASSVAGAFSADLFLYALGRFSSRIFERYSSLARAHARLTRLTNRLGPAAVFATQFFIGLRTASMIYWGSRRTQFLRFVLLDLFACIVLGSIFISLGYFAGHFVEEFLGHVKIVESWVLSTLLVLALIFVTWRIARRRWLKTT